LLASLLLEQFVDLSLQVRPDTFFQVYTESAEALLQVIMQQLNLRADEVLVDAYCSIGTLTLPLAKALVVCAGLYTSRGGGASPAECSAQWTTNVMFQVDQEKLRSGHFGDYADYCVTRSTAKGV